MKTVPLTSEQELMLVKMLLERYSNAGILTDLPKQQHFAVNAYLPYHRMAVGANSTPNVNLNDRDTFVIRQERAMGRDMKSFLPAKFTLTIACPTLGCTFALNEWRLDDDKGYLADRDGLVADPYILVVDELLWVAYRAFEAGDINAFTALF